MSGGLLEGDSRCPAVAWPSRTGDHREMDPEPDLTTDPEHAAVLDELIQRGTDLPSP